MNLCFTVIKFSADAVQVVRHNGSGDAVVGGQGSSYLVR